MVLFTCLRMPSAGARTGVPSAAKMSVPSCRWKLGTWRGNHQSWVYVASPPTGNGPKPTCTASACESPRSISGCRAASRRRVLLAGDRWIDCVRDCASDGTGPWPGSRLSPVPRGRVGVVLGGSVGSDACGSVVVGRDSGAGVVVVEGAAVVVVVDGGGAVVVVVVGSVGSGSSPICAFAAVPTTRAATEAATTSAKARKRR